MYDLWSLLDVRGRPIFQVSQVVGPLEQRSYLRQLGVTAVDDHMCAVRADLERAILRGAEAELVRPRPLVVLRGPVPAVTLYPELQPRVHQSAPAPPGARMRTSPRTGTEMSRYELCRSASSSTASSSSA